MLKLLRNLRRQEWAMAAVCAVLILGQINFDLALPDYMSSLTVLIKTPGSTLSDILHTGLEMLGCTLASAVLCVICGYLTAKVAAGFSFSIREAVFHKIADFGQQEMMTFSVPSLINRTTNDITQVQMLTAMGLQILIKSPVMAVWAIIKIVGKSWTLSAITAGFVAALLVMMAVIIGVVVPRFRRVQKLTDHINLVARENLNGINVVHAYNAEDYQNAKFWKGNEELMRTQLFNQRAFAFLMPGVTLAMNALSLVIYWVGASIVNAVPAADTAARLAAFSDIVVFGTYATYVIMSIMMMVAMLFSMNITAFAVDRIGAPIAHAMRSSSYLDSYSVGIEARGNGTIAVTMTVDGKGKMEKIGVIEVEIEQKVNGNWRYYDSQYGAEHPEFYDYNTWDYVGTTYFQGTPGVSYRVTLTVYARNSKGSDTGYITSYTVVCR